MRKLIFTFFTFLVTINLGLAQNLITNGDFETGDTTKWGGAKNLSVQSEEKNTGSYAAEIKEKAWFNQYIAVTAGKTYRLKCHAKNDTVNDLCFFSAQFNNGSWNYLRYVPLTSTEWKEYSFIIRPDEEEITKFRLAFSKDKGYTQWIDDIELTEITNPETLSNEKAITGTSIGNIDNSAKLINNIPPNLVTVDSLLKALTLSPKAEAVVFASNHRWINPSSFVNAENYVKVFAENGTYQKYTIAIADQVIKSVSAGALLDNEKYIISNITPVLSVAEFKNDIELYSGASIAVLNAATFDTIANPNDTIKESMIVRVTGTYGQRDYTLSLRAIGTGNSIISTRLGVINAGLPALEDIPQNMAVYQLLGVLALSDYATAKVTDSKGNEIAGDSIVYDTLKINVRAENGDIKLYSISLNSQKITEQVITDQNVSEANLNLQRYILKGKSELHITDKVNPLTISSVFLGSEDAWLFFDNILPQTVADSFLTDVRALDKPAILDSTVRVVQYLDGSVVIPHSPDYEAVTVYSGTQQTGKSMKFKPYTFYYDTNLKDMDNTINSFTVKRGYYVTMAQNGDGTGYSKVFIADKEDLVIDTMPAGLENKVSFIRVIPWRWPHKKGWTSGRGAAEALNCSWHYNWSAGGESTLNIEYIPIKQKLHWPSNEQIRAKKNTTHLLGLNEPDRPDQANCSVEEALEIWPDLMATGLRLGSPAPSDGGLNWLFKFIEECDERNYRVDFVAMHWYLGCQTAKSYYDRLKWVHQKTGRTIWITEWNNGANWTKNCIPQSEEEQKKKIAAMIEMLDTTSFVERYSIYEYLTKYHKMLSSWDPYTYTLAGEAYRDNKSPLAFNEEQAYESPFNELPLPTNLEAVLSFVGEKPSIILTWDDVSEYENGVKIERAANGGEFKEIARIEKANVTTYADTSITFGGYAYRVRQVIVDKSNSPYSGIATASYMRLGDINIALDKPVTASSTRGDYIAEMAVDGNISSDASRWLTGSGASYPHWIEIDLQGTYEISFIKAFSGYKGYNRPLNNFKFQYWNGSAWGDLLNIKNNSNSEFYAGFEPTLTNKVRLEVTKADEDVVKLFEIEVFGKYITNTNTPNNNTLSLFPSVSSEKVYITGLDKENLIHIYDMTGTHIKSVTTSGEINVSELKSGIYILQIEGNSPLRFIKN